MMKKLLHFCLAAALAVTMFAGFGTAASVTAQAADTSEGIPITWGRQKADPEYDTIIAYKVGDGVYDFVNQKYSDENRRALDSLAYGKKKVTINIKDDIKIDTFLRPGSNTTINAGKHTITTTSDRGVLLNEPKKASYTSFQNVTINGGIWKNSSKDSGRCSMFRICYATNIKIKNATIYTNYGWHAIELIACNKCKITNCKIKAVGSCPSSSVEEQIQIDLCTPRTAPGIYELPKGKTLCNGTPSKNITVEKCTVRGARGICANYAANEPQYRKAANYHSNIKIKNCKVTGKSAEAVAIFNTKSAEVTGCTITTNAPRSRNSYSVGLNVQYQVGSSPKADTKNKIKISKNTVKGAREAIVVYSHTGQRFGSVTVTNNKAYAKSGASTAIKAAGSGRSTKISGNKTYKW